MEKMFEKQASPIEKGKGGNEKDNMFLVLKQKMAFVFGSHLTGRERVDELIGSNRSVIDLSDDRKTILGDLEKCVNIKDRRGFAEAAAEALWPLIASISPENLSGEHDCKVINEFLTYEVEGSYLYIHVFSGGLDGKISVFIAGLREIAKIIEKDSSIKKIQAISWIANSNPKILEKRLGFTVQEEIDKDIPERFYPQDGRVYKQAYMAREDFLKKYFTE
ncbi:MAG: hypothetical protein WC022_01995 [Parcubacteria group bacterium]